MNQDPRVLADGQGRVLLGFTIDELEELAFATSSGSVRLRLARAIGLLDAERERRIRVHHQAVTDA